MQEIVRIIKEFIVLVVTQAFGELGRNAGRGMGIMFLSMLAFFCIVVGVFLSTRLASVYYITPEGKKKFLGDIYLKEGKRGYTAKIPPRLLEKSDSIYYYMEIPQEFIGGHYMEKLFLDTPSGKKLVPVKKIVRFQIGLGEQLAPISFS
ncbi:MAG: hypothetical protein K2K54_07890 [Lachnospiraceae bacterium]|nr:hypothetical protein [Lachnospiraceae bacterium]